MLCWKILLLGSLSISQFSFPIKIWKLQFSSTAAVIEIALALLAEGCEAGKEGERNSHSAEELVEGGHRKGMGRTGRLHISRNSQEKREKRRWHMSAETLFHCVPISYFNELRNLVQTQAKTESSPPCSISPFDRFTVLPTCAGYYLHIISSLSIL